MSSGQEHPDVTRARAIAQGVHAGQLDGDGLPVLERLERAAALLVDFKDPVLTSAALLHDVMVDSQVGVGDLEAWAVPGRTRRIVSLLTVRGPHTDETVLVRACLDTDASVVELAYRLAARGHGPTPDASEQRLSRSVGVLARLVEHRAGVQV